jgi:hypothetical protein
MFNRAPRAALLEYDEKPASPHAREASARAKRWLRCARSRITSAIGVARFL